MPLKVECVVDSAVHTEEALGGAQDKLLEAADASGRASALGPDDADALALWFHLK